MSSSVERNNPPPRRKSCDGCRAAKRRCDLAFPTCFRCSRRGIPCVYPGLPAADQIPELLALLNERVEPVGACAEQFSFASVPPTFDPPALDFPGLETPTETFQNERQYSAPVLVRTSNNEMTHVRSNTFTPLSELMESRFRYAIDTLKDVPRMMVVENQTPWSHAQLYINGMPKVMQDAYACCALYITKNTINAPIITSHIHSRLQEITLSSIPTSPPDLLAHTHALLLYTIMHLFDTDLAAANGYSSLDTLSMSALESSASLLFSTTHFPPPHDRENPNIATNLTPTSTPNFWPLWLTEESARRTILFTFYFLQIIRLFRGDENMKCDGKLGLLHSWYSSAYLWNAPSATEFALYWSEKEHFIVRNVDFGQVLNEATPDDVDVFGRMLLVTSQGVEKVREWFWGKGAIL
ncbi:Zn(II)2Cys6 transcription factor domain-containing protein [Aspergillus stella-maris]|uniref:Zn(II)2Cys6 transcription factor domain-containing protein n=1 Tax=Aspergillus stella-maris TaxID=1810926 RepID=UPI003CCCD27D